jgi:integrase
VWLVVYICRGLGGAKLGVRLGVALRKRNRTRTTARLLDRPIASITQEDVLRILTPLSERASSFASITQSRIAEVFDYARACGLVSKDRPNPAERGVLKFLLPKRKQAVNRPALHYSDVPALIAELRAIPLADSRVVAARALEFVILTALRAGEACNAVSAEFDFDKRLFTVPAERMKSGKEHVLPLCERGMEIVAELAPLRSDDGIVFTAQRRAGAIGSERLLKLLKALRPGFSVHGFRSSFRDWCGDQTTFPREIAEAALAHVIGGVEGSYRRGTALDKRAELMALWAAYCGGEEQQKVVALRRLSK